MSSPTYYAWKPKCGGLEVPMMWINSVDDFIIPRHFPYSQEALKRMPAAHFRLIAETAETHGHGTHSWTIIWKAERADPLKRPE